jgi:DNA primase catalytic core
MIAEAELQDVKASADIVAVAESLGLAVVRKGKDHFAKCPFHADADASLSINRAKGVYHCFGCDAKGNVIQLVQHMEKVSFPEAFERLVGKDLGLSIPVAHSTPNENPTLAPEERKELLAQAWKSFCTSYERMGDGRRYLEDVRGLVKMSGVEVGYCPADFGAKLDATTHHRLQSIGFLGSTGRAHFADCVVFALRSIEGEVLGFYGRKVKGQGSHFYLPGKREGLFYRKSSDAESVIVTESVIDALTVMEYFPHDVVALHGVNGFTQDHADFLSSYRRVYLLLDGDRTGLEAAHRLAPRLTELRKKVHVVELPNDEDPNSFLLNAIKHPEHVSWLASQLRTIEPVERKMKLVEERGAFVAKGGVAEYAVQGLATQGMDRLKVVVRATLAGNPSAYFLDTPDLYSRKARASFVDGIREELGLSEEDAQNDIKALVTLLEAERLKLLETQEEKVPEMTDAERAEALSLLRSPTLVNDVLKDLDTLMVGEEDAKLMGYLGTLSRFLDKPLGILVVSRSGAGKTALQESVCSLVPPESMKQFTRITGQTLFYGDHDSLRNKVLAIEEEGGMEGAMYAIRTLQSSQKLVLGTTRNDPKTGRIRQESYTVEGPVFIMISTTNPDALGGETRNRFVVLTIDESDEQTRRIVEAAMWAHTLEGRMELSRRKKIMQRHHNMQRLLKPVEVVNPYARFLEYSLGRLQMRREQAKYACLIDAVALLHQHQREVKTYQIEGEIHAYIEVTPADIALANRLALSFFPNSTDELAPHTRRLGEEVSKLVESKGGDTSFTRRELRSFCGWSDWQVREGLKQLEELECVSRTSGRNGELITYGMLVDLRTEPGRGTLLLTDPVELTRRMEEWQNGQP